MKYTYLFAASLLLSACATAPQQPQGTSFTITRHIAEGKSTEIIAEYSTNPDCSNLGYATIRVTTPPANGKITITKGTAFPSFNPENSRSNCNNKRVASMNVTYTPNRGFIGQDTVVLNMIYASGNTRTNTFILNVR